MSLPNDALHQYNLVNCVGVKKAQTKNNTCDTDLGFYNLRKNDHFDGLSLIPPFGA